MSRSRIDPFDHMTHTAHAWLADVAAEFDTEDRRFAYRVLRAWLHALRDRLTVDAAAKFAAQLPELLRGVYYDGWSPSRVPEKYGPDEYTRRFADEARIPAADVPTVVPRVSAVMQRRFSTGQLEEAFAEMPEPLRSLLEVPQIAAASAPRPVHPAPDERIARLEGQVSNLTDAVRALARGLEERPGSEPAEHRAAEAARIAHELLLAPQQ